MTQVLRGNIVHAPKMGELSILEHGYMVLEDGVIRGVYPTLPEGLAQAEVRDYGDRLLMLHEGKVVLDRAGQENQDTQLDEVLQLFNEISVECGN